MLKCENENNENYFKNREKDRTTMSRSAKNKENLNLDSEIFFLSLAPLRKNKK